MGKSTRYYICIPASLLSAVIECEVLEDFILNTSDHLAVRGKLDFGNVRRYVCADSGVGRIRWDKMTRGDLYGKYTYPVNILMLDMLANTDLKNLSSEGIDEVIQKSVTCSREKTKVIPKAKYKPNV